ncbi:MAG: hypothetical protein AAFV29_23235, partial [Myxococcota bacterium]
MGNDSVSQIFRLEGPAAVIYFRGAPHLHAFINIGMDGNRPLSVGEVIANNPAPIEGSAIKALFERALLVQTGADFAYYPAGNVAERLRAGPIRTGDIYSLESWQDFAAVVQLRARDIGGPLLAQLRAQGHQLSLNRTYSIATSVYIANERARDDLGATGTWERMGRLRDVLIDYIRSHGLRTVAT